MTEQTALESFMASQGRELCPVCKCCEMDDHYVDCFQCGGDGEFDEYEEDAINFAPGESYISCSMCAGDGGWSIHYCIGGCMDGKVHARTSWEFLED